MPPTPIPPPTSPYATPHDLRRNEDTEQLPDVLPYVFKRRDSSASIQSTVSSRIATSSGVCIDVRFPDNRQVDTDVRRPQFSGHPSVFEDDQASLVVEA